MARGKGNPATNAEVATGYEAELWRMADALRGTMGAAEYKHVVLGLVFLKYISNAFEERHLPRLPLKGGVIGAWNVPVPTSTRWVRPLRPCFPTAWSIRSWVRYRRDGILVLWTISWSFMAEELLTRLSQIIRKEGSLGIPRRTLQL